MLASSSSTSGGCTWTGNFGERTGGPVGFFTAWGLWNLFYYPHLGQWWSFVGGCLLVLVNAVWLVQVAYFALIRERERV